MALRFASPCRLTRIRRITLQANNLVHLVFQRSKRHVSCARMWLGVFCQPTFVLRPAQPRWIVTKYFDDIDLRIVHYFEPLLVNELLRCRRHAMYAAIAREAFFTVLEENSRLNQGCE